MELEAAAAMGKFIGAGLAAIGSGAAAIGNNTAIKTM